MGAYRPRLVSDHPSADLTRADLAGAAVEVLNRGNFGNPDVLLVPRAVGPPVVVKDFRPRAAWVRATLGRWVARREARAYRALETHPAVPGFRGWIDALAFAVEYRPGRRMSRKLAGTVPVEFADRLAAALDQMHALGVVHLDLRHRSNVLVDERGAPVLIDFGSALTLRPGSWLARLLLPPLAWIDRRAVEKWRVRLQPPG